MPLVCDRTSCDYLTVCFTFSDINYWLDGKKGDYEGQKESLRRIHILIPDTHRKFSEDMTLKRKRDTRREGERQKRRQREAEKERGADWRTHWVVWICFDFLYWVLSAFKYSLKLKKHKGACVCVCLYLIFFCFLHIVMWQTTQAIVYPLKQCNRWFIEAFDLSVCFTLISHLIPVLEVRDNVHRTEPGDLHSLCLSLTWCESLQLIQPALPLNKQLILNDNKSENPSLRSLLQSKCHFSQNRCVSCQLP